VGVVLILRFTGVDADQYDAVLDKLGFSEEQPRWPDGMINHVAGPIPGGWCVVDTWVSREHFDDFLRRRLKPAFDAVGGLPDPDVTTFPIHFLYPVD
jgi:hypothetical protein